MGYLPLSIATNLLSIAARTFVQADDSTDFVAIFRVRAAMSINEPELRERQAGVLRFAGSRFTDLMAPRFPKHLEALEAAIDGSVRMLVSVMYVSLIFEGVEMSRKPLTDRALIQTLVQSITALLKAAQHGEG